VVAINPKNRERLLLQPLAPVLVCFIFVPIQAKISENDDIIISRQILLLGKVCGIQFANVDGNMSISRDKDHDISFLWQNKISIVSSYKYTRLIS
jgi:hypothetical protein